MRVSDERKLRHVDRIERAGVGQSGDLICCCVAPEDRSQFPFEEFEDCTHVFRIERLPLLPDALNGRQDNGQQRLDESIESAGNVGQVWVAHIRNLSSGLAWAMGEKSENHTRTAWALAA